MPNPPALRPGPRAADNPFIFLVYVASVGGSYWMNFIWFYLQERWGPDPVRNLLMNTGLGAAYIVGCVVTGRVASRVSPRSMLLWTYGLLIAMTITAAFMTRPWMLAIVIPLHAYCIAHNWPNLEMLATMGRRGAELGRAVGRYNVAWATTSFIGSALAGVLFKFHPATLTIVPCVSWCLGMLVTRRRVPATVNPAQAMSVPPVEGEDEPEDVPSSALSPTLAEALPRLARIGNMGCYVLISTLVPLIPTVGNRLGLDAAHAAAFGAIWQGARMASFFILGRWHGWHYRRRLLLGALIAMPFLFAVALLSRSVVVSGSAQAGLGLAMGLVYMSALFYSMHAQGHTSDAAAHEAIIGVGITAGPLLAASCGAAARHWGFSEPPLIAASVVTIQLALAAWIGWRFAVVGGQSSVVSGR